MENRNGFGGDKQLDGMVGGFGGKACPTPPTELGVRLTLAPTLFGNIFAWMFLAWMTVQAYTWYTNWKRDSLAFRAFVCTVIFLTLAETGLETVTAYQYFVSNWGDNCILIGLPKAITFQPPIIAIMEMMVDGFYIWRIWVFGRSFGSRGGQYLLRSVCICVGVLTLLSVACSIAIPTLFLLAGHTGAVPKILVFWTLSSALADILITVSMITVLWRAALQTFFAETRDTLSRLSRLTFQSGLLTSVLATAIFIAFMIQKEGDIHTLFAYLLGKSYPMSLLASLNARASVGSGKGRDRTDRLSSLVFAPGQVKTMTSLMLQQDPHSLQLSEALGRSYENRSAPRMNSRTHKDENPYQSAEMSGATGGARGTSFISSVSSDDDQPHFGLAIGVPNELVGIPTKEKGHVRSLSDYVV